MSWIFHRPLRPMVKISRVRQLLIVPCVLMLAGALLVGAARTPRAHAAQPGGPGVSGNVLVDQDQNLPFSQNKQNEPAITRDPLTGTLIAGANEEIGQPLC